MKKNTLTRIVILGLMTLGVMGLAKLPKQAYESFNSKLILNKDGSKMISNWIGPVLTMYNDKDGDNVVDTVDVRYCSRFTAGCMGYERNPTEKEIEDCKKDFEKVK